MALIDTSPFRQRSLSLGVTGFALLLACLMLSGYAAFDLLAQSAERSVDDAALALRSQSAETGVAPATHPSSLTILIVAACIGTLVIANAIAEADSDSVLGGVKRVFGGAHAEHLFLPVAMQSSGTVIHGHLLRLSRRRATFITPQDVPHGTKLVFGAESGPPDRRQQRSFHVVVVGSRGDRASGFFEIEGRLCAESSSEESELLDWIRSLVPLTAPA